jgi:hypothetical protein
MLNRKKMMDGFVITQEHSNGVPELVLSTKQMQEMTIMKVIARCAMAVQQDQRNTKDRYAAL